MSLGTTSKPPVQAPRGHHALTAIGIETGSAEREKAVKAAVEAERKRKPRRKSTKALIETAKRANLPVTALNPDGSVSIGQDAPQAADGNEWDAWEANRHAH